MHVAYFVKTLIVILFKMHVLLKYLSLLYLKKLIMMMPKIVSKSHNPHVLEITPANTEKEDLKRILMWYRPNIL